MKYIAILFCTLTSICIYSQKIDSLTFSRLSKELLEKHPFLSLSKEDIKSGRVKKDNCILIKDQDEYYYIGCVSNSWDKSWVTDFNKDSISDLVIKSEYRGYSKFGDAMIKKTFNILILNKKHNIIKSYSIYAGRSLGSGGGLLYIDSLKNGHIYATVIDNDLEVNGDKALNLEFFLKDKKLQEKNYLKCKLYNTNKEIFKKEINIKKSFSFDEYYNEKRVEKLPLNNYEYYTASFSGCKKRTLTFTYKNNRKSSLKPKVKKEWLKHIAFLSKNTKFKNILLELQSKLKKEKIDYSESIYHSIEIPLKNNQVAWLGLFSTEYKKDITITIGTANELYYWDIMSNRYKF